MLQSIAVFRFQIRFERIQRAFPLQQTVHAEMTAMYRSLSCCRLVHLQLQIPPQTYVQLQK